VPEIAELKKRQWSREEVAEKMNAYEEAYQRTPSQRQVAEELKIPRSTLQHWLERKASLDAEPEVVAFFESCVGVAFLHRLVLAAHFVITLLGPSGIRRVCLFLELTGLDRFVAASYGIQQQVSVAMEEAIVAFDKEEKTRLATDMKPKQITVCEDETFHPEVCLVAIEPVSNFILLERYADNRKAETWNQAVAEATEGLSVEIVQSTSDEGKGLLCHVQEELGVHHSPDVFHVQHELVKGTSGALASKKRQAEEALAQAAKQASRHQEKKEAILEKENSECLLELYEQIEQAQEQVREAQQALETAAGHQERARKAIQGISEVYHPYDLETGAPKSAQEVSAALEQHFVEIETVAAEAQLSERCVKRIEKAKRVMVEMVATVAFFLLTVRVKVEALSLAPEVENAMYHNLIPAIYLHAVAEKTQDVEQRPALQRKAGELLAPLLMSSHSSLADLVAEEKVVLETVAQECAQLFQRSSSCVEGRNGYLALYHHSLHRLGDRKLAALTTVHNYFVKRQDGTTAAERFFGSRPRDLFGWVLDQVDLPGYPAQKRSRPRPKEFLA